MKKIRDIPLLVLSCVLCSIAVNWVALPNGFVVTGLTGLSMTIEAFTGINYALIYYLMSFVVLVLTFFLLGKAELSNIIFISILYPAVLWVLNRVEVSIIFEEKLIAVALFGVLYGVGAGIAYRFGYSYGGMDTVGKIIREKVDKSLNLTTIMLVPDCLIMLIMLTAFSLDQVAYAFVGQLIYSTTMNYVVFDLGVKLYEVQMISDWSEDIEAFVIETLHKSLTMHKVKGGYSGEEKVQMDCVCTSAEYVKLREFIREENHNCFIKVLPLTHVFGQNRDFHKLDDKNL